MKMTIWIRRIIGTNNLYQHIEENNKMLSELNWANIFNNTITNSIWLNDKSFSPGRWAVGYPLLYVLYRILDEVKPKIILEFGLGQSSRMFHQYAHHNNEIEVNTLEHDSAWVKLYKTNKIVPANATITIVENQTIKFKGFDTLSISNIDKHVSNKKYDLILLDAPYGSIRYSRSQLLLLFPENINKNHFCIIVDDYDRLGEKDTCSELEALFGKYNILFVKAIYRGEKEFALYCSLDLKFLITL